MKLYTEKQVKEIIFQSAYVEYWDMVKSIVDEEGWVYTKEATHLLDTYFEANTGKPIEFQKSFNNPHWLTRGSRWRPIEISKLTPIELPSDEDIEEASPYVPKDAHDFYFGNKGGFIEGAIWMKEQIINKDK